MGVLREADTEAETDTEKEKECTFSLCFFLSEKINTGVQPRISSHTGGVNHESSYEQGNRRSQHQGAAGTAHQQI
jgi:hypothetical protein